MQIAARGLTLTVGAISKLKDCFGSHRVNVRHFAPKTVLNGREKDKGVGLDRFLV